MVNLHRWYLSEFCNISRQDPLLRNGDTLHHCHANKLKSFLVPKWNCNFGCIAAQQWVCMYTYTFNTVCSEISIRRQRVNFVGSNKSPFYRRRKGGRLEVRVVHRTSGIFGPFWEYEKCSRSPDAEMKQRKREIVEKFRLVLYAVRLVVQVRRPTIELFHNSLSPADRRRDGRDNRFGRAHDKCNGLPSTHCTGEPHENIENIDWIIISNAMHERVITLRNFHGHDL